MYKCAIILAAGEGKRMKSKLPKVLHKVSGKEMVNHVIDTIRKSNLLDINVIIGKGAEEVKSATISKNVTYSFQEKQLGTGHAVLSAKEFLKGKKGLVAIFSGDAPLITEETVEEFLNYHIKQEFKATILTSIVEDSKKYGRIIRDEKGNVVRIVEHKDCNAEELKVKEINAGMYCFDIEVLLKSLS